MIINERIGTVAEQSISQSIDYLDLDWYETTKRIQRKRNSLNITQEQLAEMINTSKNTISNVERGENPPSVEFIVNICNVLGEDPNYYILGEIPKDDIETYNNTLLKLSPQERKFVNDFLNYLIEKKRNS